MQRRSNIERVHVYPSPPTSPGDEHVLPAINGVKGEGVRYLTPGWHFDGPLPQLGTDGLLQPHHRQRQRYLKYSHQPVPDRKYQHRVAQPSSGPWYVFSLSDSSIEY